MESTNDGKGCLAMVSNGDSVSIAKLEIGFVPFENISPSLSFGKEDLRTKQPDLQSGKMISVALECGDAAGVV